MKLSLNLLAVCALLSASIAFADDWPLFRGPNRDGVTTETKVPAEWSATHNIKWQVALPTKGNSSPIVSGGKVFIAAAEDAKGNKRSLYCFDRTDGKKLWVKTVDHLKNEPAHGANLYCGSTPAADGKCVVVWHGSAGVHCYDYDGKLLWSRDLGEFKHIWGYASSPVFAGDSVILNCGPGTRSFVVALDKKTGNTIWQTPEPGGADDKSAQTNGWIGSWSTPIVTKIDGKEQIVIAQPQRVKAYDPLTGNIIWNCAGSGDLAYADLMLGNGDSAGVAVAMAGYGGGAMGFKLGGQGDVTSARLWQSTQKPPQRISTGIVFGKHLFLANESNFACYEVATGNELWKAPQSGHIFWAAMTATKDRIYVTSQKGITFVIAPDPKEFKLLAKNDIGEGTNSAIAISDGQIFLRTYTKLYCIAEK